MAQGRASGRAPIYGALFVVAGAIAAAALFQPRTAPPTVRALGSGHRAIVTAGTRLRVAESPDGAILVELVAGEALFDVARGRAAALRVSAGPASARVTQPGTVWTVSRAGQRVRIAVYAGSVAAAGAGPLAVLGASDRWEAGAAGSSTAPASPPSFTPRLDQEARALLSGRSAVQESERADDAYVPTLPEVPDLAADGRLPAR